MFLELFFELQFKIPYISSLYSVTHVDAFPAFLLHLYWICRFYFSSGIIVETICNFAGVEDHIAHNPAINKAAALITVCFQHWGIWIPHSQGTTVFCQIIHYKNYKHCLAKCYYNHQTQLVITDLSAREYWNFSCLAFFFLFFFPLGPEFLINLPKLNWVSSLKYLFQGKNSYPWVSCWLLHESIQLQHDTRKKLWP